MTADLSIFYFCRIFTLTMYKLEKIGFSRVADWTFSGTLKLTTMKESALKKIAEEKLNQTGSLDLSRENLKKIPEEGIMLLARFNQAERNHYLGILSKEDWSVEMQEIANSLLELSKTP